MRTIVIQTERAKQVVDITDNVNQKISEASFEKGICHLFLTHTTGALSVADLDPGTDLDMLDAFEEMIPKLNYRHPHDPSHVSDHILSALIGPDVVLHVEKGKLVLGTWQSVVLFEFSGPRERMVLVNFSHRF
ncbi:YjbQ family protein [Candidatus Peregrinibacteria bacterium]|nr:YjbQ family protein [Candidatus Peregrinibacteria bacterium]